MSVIRVFILGFVVHGIIMSISAGFVKYESQKFLVDSINVQMLNNELMTKEPAYQISVSSTSCPSNFTRVGDRCYYIGKFEKANWFSAKFSCELRNAELTRIDSPAEMETLNEYLLNAGFTSPLADDGFWTLGHAASGDGNFYYYDEKIYKHEKMIHTKWYEGEPNDYDGNEDCVQIRYVDGEYFMNDYGCLKQTYYICEVEPKSIEDSILEDNTELNCPLKFILVGKKCYRFENFLKLDQFMSRLDCEKNDDAILAKIENEAEMKELNRYLKQMGFDNGFWIAGDDIETEGQFYWEFKHDEMTYNKWADGEPNNWHGEDCVQLKYTQGDYLMNDFDCFVKTSFICESKPSVISMTEFEEVPRQIAWPEKNVNKNGDLKIDLAPSTSTNLFDEQCPKNFLHIGNKCWFIQKNEQENWFEAKRMCKLFHAELIKIKSAEEMNELNNYLTNANYMPNEFWITGDDIMEDGVFVWGEPDDVVTYTNWAPGEPNNLGGAENCIQLTRGFDKYYMNDYACWQAVNYICEAVPQTLLTDATTNTATATTIELRKHAAEFNEGCAKDFIKLGEKCYFIQNNQQLNWYAAERQCKNLNAHLLSVESAEELLLLGTHLIRLGHYGSDGWLLIGFWTSGNDLGNEGDFYWQSTGKNITYTNWYDNEPNNYGDMEHCLELRYFNSEYYMNDHKCLWPNYFICEADPERVSQC